MRSIFLLLIMISPFCYSANKIESPLIKQIENYLNNFENMEAHFTQNSGGHKSHGTLRIAKPGKFRWEYDDGKLLIISTGDTIIYRDNELDNVHYISADDTIAGILSQENFDFTHGDFVVENMTTIANNVNLLITNKKDDSMGKINLTFSIKPIALKAIEVLDMGDNLIQLNLSDITYPKQFDPELFNYYENHNKRR